MDSLTKKLRKVEEEDAEQNVVEHLAGYSAEQRDIGLMVIGGIRVTGQYAASMSSEAFKALIRFGDEKLFEPFGYTRFADFLDDCPYSPMTKAQFYERKALFDKEGERIFDFFGELGLSIRKRKLLGKGNVEIDGNNAIIRDGNGEETIVPIDDHARLMEVVTAVIDAKLDLQHKFDRQKEAIEKQKVTIQNAYDDLDRIKASKLSEVAATPHMNARVELGIAFRKLTETAANLSPIEKDQFRDAVLEDVAGWRTDLAAAYKTDTKRAPVETTLGPDDTLETGFDKFFEDNKLADLL